jgi:hypothetical protein
MQVHFDGFAPPLSFLNDHLDAIEAGDHALSIGRDGLGLLTDAEPRDLLEWFTELRRT